ncbi:nitroreductase family deazaflavin-dependent oxidoreductase [Streptomyces sp. NPDC048002]|uniref:nitroreductase family deazaflavin-dependent oxidoreductase n=1 Tax=unclassified Streptomyces TaxID=2593676 RepID=UPI0033FE3CF6
MAPRVTAPRRPRPPSGWRRLALRAPIHLFRIGWGRLFGNRLLLLHHVGRVSDLDHRVVLEVVSRDPGDMSWIVASGYGPRADWYQNLRHQPKTVIQVGSRMHAVTAHFLAPEEGARIMADYALRHPRTARRLCAFMGLGTDGSEASFQAAGRSIPFVRLDDAEGCHRPEGRQG